VVDLNFNRIPRATFQHALERAGLAPVLDQQSVGRVSTLNVLFCRDFTEEADHPDHFTAPPSPFTPDQILKLMIVYELHGLNDVALDTAARFRDRIEMRLDVDEAMRLLVNPHCRTRAWGPPSAGPALIASGDGRGTMPWPAIATALARRAAGKARRVLRRVRA
jgi:hypothetical protein